MSMLRVKIGELRDNVSHYVRRAAHGERIVIVNRNREVAMLVPVPRGAEKSRRLLGCMRGSARVVGDILSPMDDEWFQT